AHVNVLAAILQAFVAQHRAGEETGLEQNLKAVADAEHETAAFGERAHGRHDRREARHRAGPQVIAVREAAGQNHDVGTFQIRVLVPEIPRVLAEALLRGVKRVLVAITPRKDDDPESHLGSLPSVTCRPDLPDPPDAPDPPDLPDLPDLNPPRCDSFR